MPERYIPPTADRKSPHFQVGLTAKGDLYVFRFKKNGKPDGIVNVGEPDTVYETLESFRSAILGEHEDTRHFLDIIHSRDVVVISKSIGEQIFGNRRGRRPRG